MPKECPLENDIRVVGKHGGLATINKTKQISWRHSSAARASILEEEKNQLTAALLKWEKQGVSSTEFASKFVTILQRLLQSTNIWRHFTSTVFQVITDMKSGINRTTLRHVRLISVLNIKLQSRKTVTQSIPIKLYTCGSHSLWSSNYPETIKIQSPTFKSSFSCSIHSIVVANYYERQCWSPARVRHF